MRIKTVFALLLQWFRSSEMFARPSRQLPGKWKLFEYYTETGNNLINLKEDELKKDNQYWELCFTPHGQLVQQTNLPVLFFGGTTNASWNTSRNFITWTFADATDQKEIFQFAVVSGILKLLKKDKYGKIVFFGFFRKIE